MTPTPVSGDASYDSHRHSPVVLALQANAPGLLS